MADALGLAASVITVVNLFIKVGVLCSVYCADLKTAPRDVRYILNEADRLTATLNDVERLLAGPNGARIEASQNVCRGVADCRRQLGDLAAKLEEGTRYKRIMWPLKKEEVTDIIKNLERCRAVISLDLHINHTYVATSLLDPLLRIFKGITSRCPPGDCPSKATHRRKGDLRFSRRRRQRQMPSRHPG
jgi:hypothetical protein